MIPVEMGLASYLIVESIKCLHTMRTYQPLSDGGSQERSRQWPSGQEPSSYLFLKES